MNKPAIAVLAVALIVVALWFLLPRALETPECGTEPPELLEMATITIVSSLGPVELSVEVADEANERARGLMCRESLEDGSGMLFVFGSERVHPFWMKNTLIPLDAIFIGGDLTIVDIVEGAVPCEGDPCPVYTPDAPSRYAIEVNAGFAQASGIRIGDAVLL